STWLRPLPRAVFLASAALKSAMLRRRRSPTYQRLSERAPESGRGSPATGFCTSANSFVATSLGFFRQGIGPFRQPCLCHSRYRLERSMLREHLADELVNNAGNAPIQSVSAQTSRGPSRFQLRLPLLW